MLQVRLKFCQKVIKTRTESDDLIKQLLTFAGKREEDRFIDLHKKEVPKCNCESCLKIYDTIIRIALVVSATKIIEYLVDHGFCDLNYMNADDPET